MFNKGFSLNNPRDLCLEPGFSFSVPNLHEPNGLLAHFLDASASGSAGFIDPFGGDSVSSFPNHSEAVGVLTHFRDVSASGGVCFVDALHGGSVSGADPIMCIQFYLHNPGASVVGKALFRQLHVGHFGAHLRNDALSLAQDTVSLRAS